MSETRRLTVDLPASLVRMLEEKVAAGEYVSESALVQESLEALRDVPGPDDIWLRREAVPVHEACTADPSRLRVADDVFARLEERYREDMRRLGHEP